ncbi:MAG: hypothetical protein GX595_08225 [Lentisphaerae bacterium]|nr:hypothetical protein [Lentisphaerota bacterium]
MTMVTLSTVRHLLRRRRPSGQDRDFAALVAGLSREDLKALVEAVRVEVHRRAKP